MDLTIQGYPVIPGEVRSQVLASPEPLSFWGGYDFHKGKIIDTRHPLVGQIAAGKILALPFTRGSSTSTAILLESVRAGTAPAAILSTRLDSFFALASILADELYASPFPLITISQDDFALLKNGQLAHIYPNGRIRLSRHRVDR